MVLCRYQASRSGYDRGPSWLPASLIRQYFLPPFAAAVRAGVASAMTAYNTPDDVPIVIGQKWTRKWLRGEAGFKGCVITDWTEIYNQLDWHHSASTPVEAVSQALSRTSIDMVRMHSPTLLLYSAVGLYTAGALCDVSLALQ